MIPEALVQQIWKDQHNYLSDDLRLCDGTPITILEAGIFNDHRGGPDFLSARILIDGIAISGDIELHLSASDWHAHGHEHDQRYSNVILHVVLSGEEVAAGPSVPTLILQDHLAFGNTTTWTRLFEQLYSRSPELPCYPHNLAVPMKLKRTVIEKFGEARLEELIDRVLLPVDAPTEDEILERVYQLTLDALGYSQNRTPLRELSSLLPRKRLQFVREASDATVSIFEALYLGMAGLIDAPSLDRDVETNEYLVDLSARWNSLKTMLKIRETLTEGDWAFFRIRPMNSPFRRLALAAHLAWKYFSHPDWDFRSDFFRDGPRILDTESYWAFHTSFSEPLNGATQLLGEERRSAIWLNVVLPSRIARLRTLQETASRATEIRELTKEWGETRTRSSAKYLHVLEQELLEGESVNSVRSEQGGLLLLRNFCEKRRCYECPIGDRLKQRGWSLK